MPGGNCSNMASAYDANGDGSLSVLDYVCDTRVSVSWADRHGPAGALTAEDLIHAFSNGGDDDHNGFVDDVAGWDFFDNDNNPYDASSYFAAANHGTGRAENAAERGNEGSGGLGVCPHCQIMPLRTWDTFVSDGNTFAMGMVYATDNGAAVIEGANGSTYHSAFAEAASQYAYAHGVVQTYSGDDLNTGNHNYAANYGHAMLIQGTVPDTIGLGEDAGSQVAQALQGLCGPISAPAGCPGTSLPATTYFRGANTTQYGGKSSISMEGTTGSENTGKAAGAAGIVISAARDRTPSITLRPDEVREILEQTAERVTTGNTGTVGVPDPAADPTAPRIDQWTTHFGWGRVNLGAAVALARSGKAPPEAAIDSPDWYAPLTGSSFKVTGLARARFATGHSFNWTASVGGRGGPRDLAHGQVRELEPDRHGLRLDQPGQRASRPRQLHAPGGRRRSNALPRRAESVQARVHGPPGGQRPSGSDPRRRPTGIHLRPGPEPARRLIRSGWAPAARRRFATRTSTGTTARS